MQACQPRPIGSDYKKAIPQASPKSDQEQRSEGSICIPAQDGLAPGGSSSSNPGLAKPLDPMPTGTEQLLLHRTHSAKWEKGPMPSCPVSSAAGLVFLPNMPACPHPGLPLSTRVQACPEGCPSFYPSLQSRPSLGAPRLHCQASPAQSSCN